MKNIYTTLLLVIISSCFQITSGQNSLNSRFIFEFYKNDTSLETVFDTVYIGLDTFGGPGYQQGLDIYVDSLNNPGVFIFDSLFSIQFPDKYLKKSVEKVPLLNPRTSYRLKISGFLKNIFWDSSDFSFIRNGNFFFAVELIGPKGSSIGSWDNNVITLILGKETYGKNNIEIFELPFQSVINIYIHFYDSSLIGNPELVHSLPINVFTSIGNTIVLKSQEINIWDNMELDIIDILGNNISYTKFQVDVETRIISFGSLVPGIYLFRITTNRGSINGRFFISN